MLIADHEKVQIYCLKKNPLQINKYIYLKKKRTPSFGLLHPQDNNFTTKRS